MRFSITRRDTSTLFASVACLALIVGLVAGCISGHRIPYQGLQPPVRDLSRLSARLSHAVASSPRLTLAVLGHVVYDEFEAPFWAIQFVPPGPAVRTVFLSGGIHGDEPASVEHLTGLVEKLAHYPAAYPTSAMLIIPLINPWGWTHDKRFNAQGIDINRDFTRLRSQEAQLLQAFMAHNSFDMAIALHQDHTADGFYLFDLAGPEPSLALEAVACARVSGYPIADRVRVSAFSAHDGVVHLPWWSLWYLWATRQIGMTGFCRLVHTRQVFVLESPATLPIAHSTAMYAPALHALITSETPLR